MNNQTYDVVGIGNAIVDLLSEVDEEFITRHELTKSSMRLCSQEEQAVLIDEVPEPVIEAGGSVGNSMSTLGSLGLSAAFIGSVASDKWGAAYMSSLAERNVDFISPQHDSELISGTSIILITPDSERTMNTHLGEAAQISKETIAPEPLERCDNFFIEGYAYDTDEQQEAVEYATDIVIEHGGKISLTLSDPWCVQRHKEDFAQLLPRVDYLLCNNEEFSEMFEISVDDDESDVLARVSKLTNACVVVTRSEKGCIVIDGVTFTSVQAGNPESLLDLTGAGDQFAAGFLYGISQNESPQRSAELGIELATRVISKIGPRLSQSEIDAGLSSWSD